MARIFMWVVTSLQQEDPNANFIARWDGSSWHALGSGLDGGVESIVIDGSNVYVGGYFTEAGGNTDAKYLACWDGDSWNAVSNGLNAAVTSILVDGTDLYVGGRFTDAGGEGYADFIARWDGDSWNPLGTGLAYSGFLSGSVSVIKKSGTDFYIGGSFTQAGGDTSINGIARWDGSTWHSLGDNFGGYLCQVSTILIDDSKVYAGYYGCGLDDVPYADTVGVWDGVNWNSIGTGLNLSTNEIVKAGSTIVAGGSFYRAGGDFSANYIARFGDRFPNKLFIPLVINNNLTINYYQERANSQ